MKILLFVLIMFVCSCRSVKYVPIESVKTKTEYVDRFKMDSIYVLDSVFVFVKGDTVLRDRWRIKYQSVYMKDTVNIEVRDTIQVLYPVEVVRNKVPGVMWWIVLVLAAFSLPSIIRIMAKLKSIKF